MSDNTLEPVLRAAKELPVEELPRFLGDIEEIRRTAEARLMRPPAAVPPPSDRLIDVDETARLIGRSKDWVYRNKNELPLASPAGRRLLFSLNGIQEYIQQLRHKAVLTARQHSSNVAPVSFITTKESNRWRRSRKL